MSSEFRVPESPCPARRASRLTRSLSRTTQKIAIDRSPAAKRSVTPTISGKLSEDIDKLQQSFEQKMTMTDLAEKFFSETTEKSRFLSSNKTLASLGNQRLTPDQARELLDHLPQPLCQAAIDRRIIDIRRLVFPRIIIQLINGYDVIAHGFGSKFQLLESFVSRYLKEENCIVVPGYRTDISISQILNTIINTFSIDVKSTSKSPTSLANTIRDFFDNRPEEPLFVVVHNIDGPVIRNSLDDFMIMAQSKSIRFLASVDHMHADRLWTKNAPNWIWHDCTTALPYTVETCAVNSRLMSESSVANLDSLKAVTASLGKNPKQIFLILAKYQLESNNSKVDGMLVENLLRKCKESFLVTNEMALRNTLIEFKDHKIIQFRIGSDRSEYVKILLDTSSIEEFVNNFNNF